MPDEVIAFLLSSPNKAFKICCASCDKLFSHLKETQERVESVESKLNKLAEDVSNLLIQSKKAESPCMTVETIPNSGSFSGPSIKDSVKEMLDREKRKTNLVIFNIAESNSQNADMTTITKMFEDIEAKDIIIWSMERLGKPSDKTRPLCVTLGGKDTNGQFSNLHEI